MLKSMTGYGRSRTMLHGRDITIEIRSVNNRYLDCAVKLPRAYVFAEPALRGRVQRVVSRGKLDVFVTVDTSAADAAEVRVNRDLAIAYTAALRELSEISGFPDYKVLPDTLARFPDVITIANPEEDLDTVTADLCQVLDTALDAHREMRIAEGEKLSADIASRLDTIERLVGVVEARSPETVTEYRQKLTARMQDVLQTVGVDEQRLLTEAAVYADKIAVDEETVRLRSHVSQLRTMLSASEAVGRKMDFLIQELNREANTIGSKCSDSEITKVVVELKAEVEKIREQVQNVE